MGDDQLRRGFGVEVISSKGCSRMFNGRINNQLGNVESISCNGKNGPFSGLVICVTGLSKDTRKQVMDATESFHGSKFEHASKHGSKLGLCVVTLGWFVDSVKRNVRLSESLYKIRFIGDIRTPMYDFDQLIREASLQKSFLPVGKVDATNRLSMNERTNILLSEGDSEKLKSSSSLRSCTFYIDEQVSVELKNKVTEALSTEAATLVGKWFVGSCATYVVCEESSVRKYLGHSCTLVTPLWVLKTIKEKHLQRLVHLSADLARQTGTVLETYEIETKKEDSKSTYIRDASSAAMPESYEVRQKIANQAKDEVRQRRGRRMQTCRTPIRPITPASLLDAICWSISEPTLTASIYSDSSSAKDFSEQHTLELCDGNGEEKESEASFINMTRPLTESEKTELILKSHYLTILFPVDRFSEIGPTSKTFFSNNGFTCIQVLEYVFSFYQEDMSTEEIEVAIHSDSRHADRLRSMYAGKETSNNGCIAFKRIEFLGSRRSFEMLKRVAGENSSNVYELLIRA
ncbi:hypothetical protein LIER_15901 [Lithospermum erythrorhizon]|uniref:BRCT domain-containing protein n=1 Tax=Lithospermum erythrorhizon TaxID=34254 RepID=A0AAV3Q748_LITER